MVICDLIEVVSYTCASIAEALSFMQGVLFLPEYSLVPFVTSHLAPEGSPGPQEWI